MAAMDDPLNENELALIAEAVVKRVMRLLDVQCKAMWKPEEDDVTFSITIKALPTEAELKQVYVNAVQHVSPRIYAVRSGACPPEWRPEYN